MTMSYLAINIIFALLLLAINGILGKWKRRHTDMFSYSSFNFTDVTEDNFSDNFFQLLIHPAIFLAIISATLQFLSYDSLVRSLWLVVPLYWALRFIIALFQDMLRFINLRLQLVLLVCSLIISEGTFFLIIIPLLNKGKEIFIDLEQFRDAFWFAVLCFMAKFIWDFAKQGMIGRAVYPPEKKSQEIIRRYDKYYFKYAPIVDMCIDRECSFHSPMQKERFRCMVFAIMIYESHNRPFLFRIMEYIIKFFCPRKTMSLGIMQVQTDRLISNKTSILLAIKKLYNAFRTGEGTEAIDEAIDDYNPSLDYFNEVKEAYYILTDYLGFEEYCRQKVKVRKRNKKN